MGVNSYKKYFIDWPKYKARYPDYTEHDVLESPELLEAYGRDKHKNKIFWSYGTMYREITGLIKSDWAVSPQNKIYFADRDALNLIKLLYDI